MSGTASAGYSYEPFGRTTIVGSSNNSFQFTGRENDGTGLYFYRARYYSPTLHRFVAEDPSRFAGGEYNLYGYVRNNPVRRRDPTGLFSAGGMGTFPPSVFPPSGPNPSWDVPPGSACDVYGDSYSGWTGSVCRKDSSLLSGCWGNCVRGCLLDDFDSCKKEYRSGFVPRHLECWAQCTEECIRSNLPGPPTAPDIPTL